MSEPLSPDYEAAIREHVDGMSNYSLGNLFARDLLAEVERLRARVAELEGGRAAALTDAADRIERRADQLGGVWLRTDQVCDALRKIAATAEARPAQTGGAS